MEFLTGCKCSEFEPRQVWVSTHVCWAGGRKETWNRFYDSMSENEAFNSAKAFHLSLPKDERCGYFEFYPVVQLWEADVIDLVED